MMKTIFKAIFRIATLLCGLSVALGACVDDTELSGSCDHKTRCLNDAISCLTGEVVYNKTAQALFDQKLKQLEMEVATLKAQLAKAGQPGGFATLDDNGRVSQKLLPGGFDQYSAYDLGWQSLHMAAAAACRGSTPAGGSGCCQNPVLVRNTADLRTCRQICAQSSYPNCDAEVSVYGKENKATQNGEIVGWFYNYKCDDGQNGGSEASGANEAIMGYSSYFGFCCCRK